MDGRNTGSGQAHSTRSGQASSGHAEAQQQDGGIKETVESILVAFILAFIFRAFVVEAFVIPTGSMAPTLFGAHMRLHCPDCGYTFDVNYPPPGERSTDGDEPNVPATDLRKREYHCPNCGYPFARDEPQQVRFGDRILVLKYLYLFQQPKRWDVVVFKSPSEEHHSRIDPEYGQNYIKRLIGKPNESIVILDGDIYVGPPGATRDTPEQFKIQRKPDYAQGALWRTIFDNDYLPTVNGRAPLQRGMDSAGFREPWTLEPGSTGWDVGTTTPDGVTTRATRTFTFSNPQGAGSLLFDSTANPDCHSLTDHLAYDEAHEQSERWDAHPVSDLRLDMFYRRTSGDGSLQLQLTKNSDCFTAHFTPAGVELWRGKVQSTAPLVVAADQRVAGPLAVPALGSTKPVRIELTNVDYRASIRVDGREILHFDYDPPVKELFQQPGDDEGRLAAKPAVRIIADHQTCTLEHVLLARDVYYLNYRPGIHFNGSPENIMHLGDDEYFVLGDNSFISGDARYWGDPVDLRWGENLYADPGRVPGRFMLGKAFYVYWPAGFRPAGIPIGITPDFGEMRFIH